MRIVDVVCAKGYTGFYYDDQEAIKGGAPNDGMAYLGEPVTPGFEAIRQPGEAISVMLVLENDAVAWGDCVAVQYSGAAGRDPLFLAQEFIPIIDSYVKPVLVGKEADNFKPLAETIDKLQLASKPLHTAIRYGVTQAVLDAVAKSQRKLMCEVIATEYNTKINEDLVPIYAQSGDDRHSNADKMIIKGIPIIPHGLINNVQTKLGEDGSLLLDYVKWLRERILRLRTGEDYLPTIHIDTYGTIGQAFGNDNPADIVSYLGKLKEAAEPFALQIEGPVDAGGREEQMLTMKAISRGLAEKNIGVKIVADEWCNTLEDVKYFAHNRACDIIQIKSPDLGGINNIIEAVLYCKEVGVGAYLGGSCNESDRSAQICVHIAMATAADQILSKPGMGVDEGYMTTYNEMQRILALRSRKRL